MEKGKATITLDRAKVEAARALIGDRSMSEIIDVALGRLIAAERLRHDVEAYRRQPPSTEELATADLAVAFDLADDDTNYDALYG